MEELELVKFYVGFSYYIRIWSDSYCEERMLTLSIIENSSSSVTFGYFVMSPDKDPCTW